MSPFRATDHPHLCKCGHDRTHPMVSPVAEYTRLGWALILIGISAEPIAIGYKCRRCETLLERTTDKKTIAETQLWG